MRVLRDDIWMCLDCMLMSVNGECGELDEPRLSRVRDGLEGLGPNIVPNFDTETGEGHRECSSCGCDCCGSHLAGEMHRFAILGP